MHLHDKTIRNNPKPFSGAPAEGKDESKNAVPAIRRAVRLLDILAAAKEPMSLAALTQALALPKSTVHALCTTLAHDGLLRRSESSAYHLGMHIMDWSHAILTRSDAAVEFARLADSLEILPEETIILSVLDGMDVVHVGCRNGTRPLGLNFRIGMRMPANTSASGKAILSTIPEDKLVNGGPAGSLRRLTKKSITDLPTLLKQLAIVRKRGYSVDDEETSDGMMCFGAPVFDSTSNQAVGGVAVSFLKASLAVRERVAAIQAIRHLALMLSKRLGCRGYDQKSARHCDR